MILTRSPKLALQPFVSTLWSKDAAPSTDMKTERELMLPTGAMHVVIRLDDSPLRIFTSPDDTESLSVGACILNGVRTRSYCKETLDPVPSVGAMLRPGVSDLLSNTPAGELVGRHTRLEDLWQAAKLAELRERLEATPSLAQRLSLFENVLANRLPVLRGIDPLVAHSLFRFRAGMTVGKLVAESGFSHRHVVRVFTQAVGVPPKTYLRLRRFTRTLGHLHAESEESLADTAAMMGYADQAHMTREFRDFAGLTPSRYLRARRDSAHHVPLLTLV